MRVVHVVNGQVLDCSFRNGLVIIKGTCECHGGIKGGVDT